MEEGREARRGKVHEALPERYVKPMAEMLSRFTENSLGPGVGPGNVAGGAAVGIAIAIVIVLWREPLDELVLTDEEKAAIRFAAQEVRANPDLVKRMTGLELTGAHVKVLEALAL